MAIAGRAAFLKYVMGTGIITSWNVANVQRTGVGTYEITLQIKGAEALGIVNVNSSRADGSAFGDFTAVDKITVTTRAASNNALVDIPNGTVIVLEAHWANSF